MESGHLVSCCLVDSGELKGSQFKCRLRVGVVERFEVPSA